MIMMVTQYWINLRQQFPNQYQNSLDEVGPAITSSRWVYSMRKCIPLEPDQYAVSLMMLVESFTNIHAPKTSHKYVELTRPFQRQVVRVTPSLRCDCHKLI